MNLLIKTDRLPEAALYARTFLPSKIDFAVDGWRKLLIVKGKGYAQIAKSIADPINNPELFTNFNMKEDLSNINTSDGAATGMPQQQINIYDRLPDEVEGEEDEEYICDLNSNNPIEPAFSDDHFSTEVNSGTSVKADDLDDITSLSASTDAYRDDISLSEGGIFSNAGAAGVGSGGSSRIGLERMSLENFDEDEGKLSSSKLLNESETLEEPLGKLKLANEDQPQFDEDFGFEQHPQFDNAEKRGESSSIQQSPSFKQPAPPNYNNTNKKDQKQITPTADRFFSETNFNNVNDGWM